MPTSSTQNQFFPSIGSLADQADKADSDKIQTTDEKNVKDRIDDDNDAERPLQEIESLCMKCGEMGVTRMMLTSIPYFKEVIVMSFRCEHCGTSNNELQSAGEIREQGLLYTCHIQTREDLQRQLVRSPSCTIVIPTFELTLPSSLSTAAESSEEDKERVTRRGGQLTTVEGLIRDVIQDLSINQPLRRIQDPPTYEKIEKLLEGLKDACNWKDEEDEGEGEQPDRPFKSFTIQLDDPAGNSFIEFQGEMSSDHKWSLRTYDRTRAQDILLGIGLNDEDAAVAAPSAEGEEEGEPLKPGEEVFVFPGTCSSCQAPLNTYMKKVNIPYFKDILIMSTNCDRCGYRDNEIKSGSAISEKGKKIILRVLDKEDLSRDLLKSETAGLSIPEIDLVLASGTLGGRFTTIEGILNQVYEELSEKVFMSGDSAPNTKDHETFDKFLEKLKMVKEVQMEWTLILDDPLANSYIQNVYAPDEDPEMKVVWYERSWEQNEELGLNDIKVEGYEEDAKEEAKEKEEAEKEKEPVTA